MRTALRIFKLIILIFISLESSAQLVQFNNGKPHKAALIDLSGAWKYKVGDDTAWANPVFNDSKWDSIETESYFDDAKEYDSIAWLRYRIDIKDSLKNIPLAFQMQHMGASEIYVDGKLLKKYGKVGDKKEMEIPYDPLAEPLDFVFSNGGEHLIAVRYSNVRAQHNLDTYNENFSGFILKIETSEKAEKEYRWSHLSDTFLLVLGIGFFLAFGLLHFILFLFYKSERSNLYYSLFTITLAFSFLALLISDNVNSPSAILSFKLLSNVLNVLNTISLLALVYSFIYFGMPRRLWIWISITALYMILVFTKINWAEIFSYVISIGCIVDVFRLTVIKLRRKYDRKKKLKKRVRYTLLILAVISVGGAFISKTIPITIFAILVLIFVLPVAGMIFIVPVYMSIRHARNFSATNKSLEEKLIAVQELSKKTLEQEKEKQKIIEAQKEFLEIQVAERTMELSQKNLEITDSINYAMRIQFAILPPLAEVKAAFPGSFVLFKPKDIVSGDFYWFTLAEDKILIAAGDCTGHGVPGAFMSTIGSEKLNEAAKDTSDVSTILNLVNRGMKKVLHQSGEEDATRDGMDIALCAFNKEMTKVEYAGANRPLWIIRKDAADIEETKATKVAIGGLTEDDQVFTKHTIDLQKGDTVYIFSDGYADQFSPQDKKLMTRKFKEIIFSVQNKSMEEQKEFLGSFIENWKGNMEQTDDILVIGVRI